MEAGAPRTTSLLMKAETANEESGTRSSSLHLRRLPPPPRRPPR